MDQIKQLQTENNGEQTRVMPSNRRLLVFVNPASGKGKAMKLFQRQVMPLFRENNIDYEVIITSHRYAAMNYVRKNVNLLNDWHGIVVVSGDGLIHEIYNGLMRRSDFLTVIKIPVGIIPGGSGNGLAHSLSYAIGENPLKNSLKNAIRNVVKGRTMPMDLIKVRTSKETFFSCLSIGWGLIADIDIESERLRLVGEVRFKIWALIRTLGLRKYRGKLSYIPYPGTYNNNKQQQQQQVNGDKQSDEQLFKAQVKQTYNRRKFISRSTSTGVITKSSTTTTTTDFAANNENKENSNVNLKPKFHRSKSVANDHVNMDENDDETNFDDDFCDGDDDNVGKLDEMNFNDSNHNYVNIDNDAKEFNKSVTSSLNESKDNDDNIDDNVDDDDDRSNWITIDDEFIMVYSSYLTHLSSDCFFTPKAKFDDGIIWLIIIYGNVKRTQIFQFLTALDSGAHIDLPFVHCVPVTRFRLEPYLNAGRLTVDGELIECDFVDAEVMPSIARIMTR